MCENGAKKSILSSEEKVTRRWKKALYRAMGNFHSFYSASNITRMIISRRILWFDHITLLEVMRNTYKIEVLKPEGKKSYIRHGRR